MIKLHARLSDKWEAAPFVARITLNHLRPEALRGRELLLAGSAEDLPAGFLAYLIPQGTELASRKPGPSNGRALNLPDSLGYLREGDIVRVNPRAGEVSVMYRRESRFNAMLLTEQCNSNCVMCSQPPKAANDDHLVQAWLEAIPLMDTSTPELGITGGEPTLLGNRLLQVILACKNYLPRTALHMLTNGRMFNYISLCRDVARINHSDLVIGIPLYSDIACLHDCVVQAKGAFDQTIRGIMNLERCGLRVELRVVLHRQTIGGLPQLARFIARNLPFVEHVALMGLEIMGHVRMNLDALWIDPVDYQSELSEAVEELARHRMRVSIYNHPLCVLKRELWPFARQSISDWKNEYVEVCADCAVRDQCGGFFTSSIIRRSEHIHAISHEDFACTNMSGTLQHSDSFTKG